MSSRTVSVVSTFLLLMMIFTVSVFNLPLRAESKTSQVATVYEMNETTPKYNGTLRIGIASGAKGAPLTLNPLLDRAAYYEPLFDTLLTYDENCSLQPDLAESDEFSESGLDLTFHLYENVSWHDGVEFNASDVKFTFDTIRDDPNASRLAYYAIDISSTEVVNASTVVFHLYEHQGAVPEYLSYVPIIPKHIYEGTNLATNPANQNPVGTGPFKFVSWTPQTNLTVTANEEYFRGRPYLDSIFVRYDIMPRAKLTVALEENTIDMVAEGLISGGDLDPSKMQDLMDTTGTSVPTREAAAYNAIWLNMSNPLLANRDVREAIAHAINKTKIVTEAFYGYASVAKGPLPPSLHEWYNPSLIDYEFNTTLAEELLDHEYPRGPDGWRFNLVLKTIRNPDTNPWEVNTLYIVRDELISIGINASIQFNRPVSEFGQGNFDAFFIGWIADDLGPDDLYDIFHSNGWYNENSYSNATLDALLEEGRTSFNETVRKTDFDRAQDIIAQDLSEIFLYHPIVALGHNSDFHGSLLSTPPVNGELTSYFLRGIWYDPTFRGKGNCPYRVCFTDSEGRRTGCYDGSACEDIPDSAYSGVDSDPQIVSVREPEGTYTVELVGKENGPYKFEFANMALDYKSVRIPEGFIHENETITYIVRVCQDGSMKVYDFDKFSEHDVGIRSVTTPKTVVGQGCTTSLDVAVFDWGDFTENFNLTVYADTTVIAVQNVTLPSGNPATSAFVWSTTGLATGNYSIKAVADAVPGEIDTTDNNITGGWVTVAGLGDLTGGTPNLLDFVPDGQVNMKDVGTVARFFLQTVPPAPSNCDITGPIVGVPDGIIDMRDIGLVARHFGQHYP